MEFSDAFKTVLVSVFYFGTCAIVSAVMAKRKNRNVGLWFVLGACLGILAIIILGMLDNAGIRWSVIRRRE